MHNQCMYLIYDMHGVKAESNQRIREKFHVTCTIQQNMQVKWCCIKRYFSNVLQNPKVILSYILHQTFSKGKRAEMEGHMLHLSISLFIFAGQKPFKVRCSYDWHKTGIACHVAPSKVSGIYTKSLNVNSNIYIVYFWSYVQCQSEIADKM